MFIIYGVMKITSFPDVARDNPDYIFLTEKGSLPKAKKRQRHHQGNML